MIDVETTAGTLTLSPDGLTLAGQPVDRVGQITRLERVVDGHTHQVETAPPPPAPVMVKPDAARTLLELKLHSAHVVERVRIKAEIAIIDHGLLR